MSELPTDTVTRKSRHRGENKTISAHNRRGIGSQIVTLWLLPALLSATGFVLAESAAVAAVAPTQKWTIQIQPRSKAPRPVDSRVDAVEAETAIESNDPVAVAAIQPDPAATPSAGIVVGEPHPGGLRIMPNPVSQSKSYRALYGSIPFHRAEYRVDPSYRHDAAMELLTGNPRPAKVYNYNYHTDPYASQPWWQTGHSYFRPYVYDLSRGPYSRYRSLFGYQGGYRPIYYQYGWPYRR